MTTRIVLRASAALWPPRQHDDRHAAFSWQDFALCAQTGPELFFPEKGTPAAPAKAICRACPVREDCLRYALAGPVAEWGIWGGFTERARRGIAGRCLAGETLADIIAADDAKFYRAEEYRATAGARSIEHQRRKRARAAAAAAGTQGREGVAA